MQASHPLAHDGTPSWDFGLREVEQAGSPARWSRAHRRLKEGMLVLNRRRGSTGEVDGKANPGCAAGRGHALEPRGCLQPQTLTLEATFSGFGCLRVTKKLLQV